MWKAAPRQALVASCGGAIEAAFTTVTNSYHELEAVSCSYPDFLAKPEWRALGEATRHLAVLHGFPAVRR